MSEDQATNGHDKAGEAELRALEADVLLARARFARQVGIAFGGERDYYEVLGYDRDITALQFRETYNRGGIAKRIVEAYPKATWRGGVELYEDEDPDKETEFEKAFKELDERLDIWSTLERADILAGQSTYSVILLGVAEGELDTPLPKGNPKQLLYLQPYWGGGGPSGAVSPRTVAAEVDATIQEYDLDSKSARFGEPLFYSLKRTNIQLPMEARKVHWSRVIHIAEGCLDDNIFGVPTLENVWNLLHDLMKVTGGGAEAFWLRANQGLHANLDKDMTLSSADGALDKLREDMERYQHGLTRWIRTRGVDVNTLGSDVANFGPSADAILKQISGSKGIPLRILTGSEQGQLASGQDAENWNSQVQDRRTSYAGPKIARRLFNRLIEYGYLPTPKKYTVGWPVEEEMTEPEKADLAVKLAQANSTMGEPLFTEAEIREKSYDMKPLTDLQRQEIDDRAQEKAAQALATQQELMKTKASLTPDKEDPFQQRAASEDEEIIRVLAAAIEAGADEVVDAIVGLESSEDIFDEEDLKALGDLPGHPFHGNQWTEGGETGYVVQRYENQYTPEGMISGADLARVGAKEAHKQLTKAGYVKSAPTTHKFEPSQKMGRSQAYSGSSKRSETLYVHPDKRTAVLKVDYQKYHESRVVVKHMKAPDA